MEFIPGLNKGTDGSLRNPPLMPGLNYYISTEPVNGIVPTINPYNEKEGVRGNHGFPLEKINYHTELSSVKILLENMKKLHPRLTEDTMEGLAYLSVHPLLSDEQRYFYKHKLEELAKKCQEEEEHIQTQRLCQSPVNQQPSNTTEHISLTSDTI